MKSLSIVKGAPPAAAAKTLVVIGKKGLFTDKTLPSSIKGRARALVLALAKDLSPSDQGAWSSSLTDEKPKKVVVGMIPDKASRYNSTAHPNAVYKILTGAGVESDGKVAVLLLLSDSSELVASLNAVGRAFPIFSRKSDKKPAKITAGAVDAKGKPIAVPKPVIATVDAARRVADLVDSPPSELNPTGFERSARKLLSENKAVRLKTFKGKDLEREGLFGIHSVGKAAVEAPRMLIASYSPKKKPKKHVVLVGKGVTFDTGGLHLKPRGFMETMKCDMGGAAAVLGAFSVLAAENYPHRLTLLLCMAENAIDSASYKPDDIIRMHSKKTVEINNTDAEGRLLLADGVSYAARKLKADVIFDAATLTGAQMIATGANHAAVVSNDGKLEDIVVAAGKSSGDLAHPLPFAPEFYRAEFKSPIADMRNSVKNRMNAQSSCAAQFVYNHIDDQKVLWAHVDLAGPAFREDRGTGYGVALLAEAARNL